MTEKDIQNFLYNYPEHLFPNQNIQEKAKEYMIKGKRIDLLFRVDGVRYVVELKNTKIKREHIGQLIEYYGLMKTYLNEANLKLILAAPIIEEWQKTYLEELGIRCVEVNSLPVEENIKINLEIKSIAPKHFDKASEIGYWVIFIDKYFDELGSEAEKVVYELKRLLSYDDSYVYTITYPVNSKRSFVKYSKVNDFLLPINHKDRKILVGPFRKIIHIEIIHENKYFFVEGREKEKSQFLNFEVFKKHLNSIDKQIKIGSKSTRKLRPKEIAIIKKIWN